MIKTELYRKMKTALYTSVAMLLLAIVSAGDLEAQTETQARFSSPEDSLLCLTHSNLTRDFMRNDDYDLAMESWRIVYEVCPLYTRNTYSRGVDLFLHRFEQTGDIAYIDTVMILYDQWFEFFAPDDQAGIDRRRIAILTQGAYHQNFPEHSVEFYTRAYELLKPYFYEHPDMLINDFYMVFTISGINLLNVGELEMEQKVEDYFAIQKAFDNYLEENPTNLEMIQLRSTNESFYWSSGILTCNNIIPTFRDQLEESPENTELMQRVISMLRDANCTEDEFYFETIERFYAFERSAESAYELAEMHWERENIDEAETYYKEAVELSTDSVRKSQTIVKLMSIERLRENPRNVVELGRRAVGYDPENGLAYYLMAVSFFGAEISENPFINSTVNWVVADYVQKALDAGLDATLRAQAEELLQGVRSRFPRSEDAFFENFYYEPGDSYTVGGWINERTTVRYRS